MSDTFTASDGQQYPAELFAVQQSFDVELPEGVEGDKNVLMLLYMCDSDEAFHLSYNYWIKGITSHFKAAEYNLNRIREGKPIK